METREEHLAWCKKRANDLIDSGDVNSAFASMASDLGKHPDTEGHSAIGLGMSLLMMGTINSPNEMRKFIDGFN